MQKKFSLQLFFFFFTLGEDQRPVVWRPISTNPVIPNTGFFISLFKSILG